MEKDSEISSILGQLRAHENELRIYIEARLPDVLPNVCICHSPENQIASSSPILSSNTCQPSDIPQQSLTVEDTTSVEQQVID